MSIKAMMLRPGICHESHHQIRKPCCMQPSHMHTLKLYTRESRTPSECSMTNARPGRSGGLLPLYHCRFMWQDAAGVQQFLSATPERAKYLMLSYSRQVDLARDHNCLCITAPCTASCGSKHYAQRLPHISGSAASWGTSQQTTA